LFDIRVFFLYSCAGFVTGLKPVVQHMNNEKFNNNKNNNNNNNNIVGTANLFL
jgi:hypothetical protein